MRRMAAILVCSLLVPVLAAPAQRPPARGTTAAQAIALEAVRQEMVRANIADLLRRFRYLGNDLLLNGEQDSPQHKQVQKLIGELESLANARLNRAHQFLRQAASDPASAGQALGAARAEIEVVVRELGSILLRAGVSQAMEVFVNELGDMAVEQEDILSQSLAFLADVEAGGASKRPELAGRQHRLAQRATGLIEELGSASAGPAQALAAVRLSQARKSLLRMDLPKLLSGSADDLAGAAASSAVAAQRRAIAILRDVESRLRPEAHLADLVRGRSRLQAILKRQQQLQSTVESLQPEQFASRGIPLRAHQVDLRRLLLELSDSLGVGDLVAEAAGAAAQAAASIEAANRPEALAAQFNVAQAVEVAIGRLEERIAKLQQVDEAYLKVQASARRLRTLRAMDDRQARLIDATTELSGAGADVRHLGTGQERLASEVERYADGIPQETNWSRMMPLPLRSAAVEMKRASEMLIANRGKEALPHEDEAILSLKEAVDLGEKEVAYLEQVWVLTRLAGDLRQFAALVEDIHREQQDVRQATEQHSSAGRTALDLTGKQETVVGAIADLKEMVAAIDEAKPFGEALERASASAGKAAAHLGRDEATPAIAAQKQAEQDLQAARQTALDLTERMERTVDSLSSMQELLIDMVDLLRLQIRLRKETEVAEARQFPRLAGEQDVLRGDTDAFATWFERNRNSQHFREAWKEMGSAIDRLNATDRDPAVSHQKLAEAHLRLGIKELMDLFEELLKKMTVGDWPELLLVFEDVPHQLVVELIVRQRGLRTATEIARDRDFANYASQQTELQARAVYVAEFWASKGKVAKIEPTTRPLETLTGPQCVMNASAEMGLAAGHLQQKDRAAAIDRQQKAEKFLRRALALATLGELERLMKLSDQIGPPKIPVIEPLGIPISGDILLFRKANPSNQKQVEAGRTDFDPLAKRDRDALNEHFARELPLEFRGLLKNYYEALSK